MEVFLYNSTVCRLCGEENDNGTLLYTDEENNQNLCEIINAYLPIKVSDDGQLPRTICPGCTIQLEATVEFLNLIINGQKVIRELHLREREYTKSLLKNPKDDAEDVITEKIVYEINTTEGVYHVEHPIALQVAGLEKPKRKRGRPPKKPKSPEQLAQEATVKRNETKVKPEVKEIVNEPSSGKRRRKTPTRFKEAVQGKELDRIFKEEGVIDADESDPEAKADTVEPKPPVPKVPEVIGHLEASGELVVVIKGKGRGRPKGRMRQTREVCVICGMEFSSVGRYMSHVAGHGAVQYRCGCRATFPSRLLLNDHQRDTEHTGLTVVPCDADVPNSKESNGSKTLKDKTPQTKASDLAAVDTIVNNIQTASLPEGLPDLTDDVDAKEEVVVDESQNAINEINTTPDVDPLPITDLDNSSPHLEIPPEHANETESELAEEKDATDPLVLKVKLKCSYCDKQFSSKQSKSLHTKAVHLGERPYVCKECGASFAYPRSLSLHAVVHRRVRVSPSPRGYACDLCGKVLNHPSSVVYHKQAAHAMEKYVCGACGKHFRHKQLLQRHQLVHSQLRPFCCKICPATFKTKANLLNHQLLHSGVKKFSCEICKHKFAHKTSLTLHMRWHTGVKPFTCEVCGKSFSQKGNLSEHERIHTGEKPYTCAHCPRRFTTSSQHRLHVRRHARAARSTQLRREYSSVAAAAVSDSVVGAAAVAGVTGVAGAAGVASVAAGALNCQECARGFASRWALAQHARAAHHVVEPPLRAQKQMSLLVTDTAEAEAEGEEEALPTPSQSPVAGAPPEAPVQSDDDERVIYVAYDVDGSDSPAFHILDPAQTVNLEENKLTTCELYSGSSLLVSQQLAMPLEHLQQQQLQADQLELEQMEQEHLELEQEQLELEQELELDGDQMELEQEQLGMEAELVNTTGKHLPVTDEQGNPLHFTMQDGTRLAITSADGKSLQVITQDGQTIPVEIDGFADEDELDPDAMVHQLNIQKTVEGSGSSPVTHYYTLV